MKTKAELFDRLAERLIPNEDFRFEWLNTPVKTFYTMSPHELFRNDPDEAIAILRLLTCTCHDNDTEECKLDNKGEL